MFDNLTNLGWGVVVFAITIGVGVIVLSKFRGAIANCTGITSGVFNATSENCTNATAYRFSYVPTNAGAVNTAYLYGQLGTSGLAGWTPAIIAFSIGMLFLGGFLIKKGTGRKY